MNGPDHFKEGEFLLRRCADFPYGEERQAIAAEANAHFLGALVALQAGEKAAGSVAWREAIGP